MDLLNLKPTMSAKIPVMNPVTGEPIEGMTYTLAGKTSPEFRAAQRAAEKQKDSESRGLDLFAGAITGIEGFEEGGVALVGDMDTKRRLLTEYDWWLEQVIEKFKEKETFLPNARNASALSQPSALGDQPKSAK